MSVLVASCVCVSCTLLGSIQTQNVEASIIMLMLLGGLHFWAELHPALRVIPGYRSHGSFFFSLCPDEECIFSYCSLWSMCVCVCVCVSAQVQMIGRALVSALITFPRVIGEGMRK
ncbi:hypothetical protein DQ04_02901030 [Trypanosoma grayi]|uniref:hypothetical protein n=1 Tax=Trypanosoma grayi TaxID=71804 RepID=UPI0004F3F184|nr:hypothetical protein DQ04_02901030 [Trypanosoma grayi]KEG11173.1 hypothetical protein DQ04_02901030 [Trypanosoma grayi]